MANPATDKLWQRAKRYVAANQAAPARAVLELILARSPDDTAAHLILGALLAADDHQRAATHEVLEAARNPPEDPGRLGDLIAAMIKVGEIVMARRMLALPAVADNNSVHVLLRAATQRQMLGEHAVALTLIERARVAGASGRDFLFYRAVQLAFNGELAAAESELERCINLDPPLGRAYVQLARTRRQTVDNNHLAAIRAALTRVEHGSEDEAALEFARYKESEDLGRHDEAWQALSRGNALMHARLRDAGANDAEAFDALIETCTAEFLAAGGASTIDGPQPIFVIGMPRSGTTVLERLLGNHPQAISAGELGDFARALAYATDHLAPAMLDATTVMRLPNVDLEAVGRMYLQQTRWRAKDKPFYVDKMPHNWMFAGLIHAALPQAKILHLVRDPMDVCFSNWRAYFGPGLEFAYSYNLDSLVSRYGRYRKVMAHWYAVMPGDILDVDYAQLVREPEQTARRILDFCGLRWEPGCVDLTRNASPSATLSMTQVRQPIHAKSFNEWQLYASQLSGLRTQLAALTDAA